MTDRGWWRDALCATAAAAHLPWTDPVYADTAAEMRAVCAACPVQAECADDAAADPTIGFRCGRYWTVRDMDRSR